MSKKNESSHAGSHVSSHAKDGKVIAIVSYITLVGWVLALVLNMEKKNSFAKFHIRQALLLGIAGFAGGFVFWIPFVGWALALALLVFWVMGLISAVNGTEKELPFIGKYAQEWFKSI